MENEFKDSIKINMDEYKTAVKNALIKSNDRYIDLESQEAKEYMCYLMGAIYFEYQRLYPDLSIYIPFRFKSMESYMKNFNKEAANPSLHTEDEIFEKTTADTIGATIVLDHINSSRKPNNHYSSDKIQELFDIKDENKKIINEIQKELDTDLIDEKTYYKYEKRILGRLIDATYPEFTSERPIPYQTELENINKIYSDKLKSGNFALSIEPEEKVNLEKLLNDLRSRLSDKLEYEILLETLPKVFDSLLIKNALKADAKFEKDVKKNNGFAAIYYTIETPFGKIEIQAQPKKRYYEAKKGSAFHSGIKGKEVDIDYFFELVDKNDAKPLEFYLDKLNASSVDKLVSDVELPNKEEERKQCIENMDTITKRNYRYTQIIEELASHIKLKDTLEFDGKIYPVDTHLLSLAECVSPDMYVCSSGHTSFSTASISHKNLVNEFSEVWRKKDSNTYLDNMLIDRLSTILRNPELTDDKYQMDNNISNALPRDISKKDITDYASRLQNERELD